MGQLSKIEWTDKTWNPVTGCSKVSQGCKKPLRRAIQHIVTSHKPSRASTLVKSLELFAAPTLASRGRVWLIAASVGGVEFMLFAMGDTRFAYFDVLFSVVCLVLVQMVDNLTWLESTAKFFFGDKSVLVNIPASVSKMMSWHPNEDVAARRKSAAAFPVRIFYSRMYNSHWLRIARSSPHV